MLSEERASLLIEAPDISLNSRYPELFRQFLHLHHQLGTYTNPTGAFMDCDLIYVDCLPAMSDGIFLLVEDVQGDESKALLSFERDEGSGILLGEEALEFCSRVAKRLRFEKPGLGFYVDVMHVTLQLG